MFPAEYETQCNRISSSLQNFLEIIEPSRHDREIPFTPRYHDECAFERDRQRFDYRDDQLWYRHSSFYHEKYRNYRSPERYSQYEEEDRSYRYHRPYESPHSSYRRPYSSQEHSYPEVRRTIKYRYDEYRHYDRDDNRDRSPPSYYSRCNREYSAPTRGCCDYACSCEEENDLQYDLHRRRTPAANCRDESSEISIHTKEVQRVNRQRYPLASSLRSSAHLAEVRRPERNQATATLVNQMSTRVSGPRVVGSTRLIGRAVKPKESPTNEAHHQKSTDLRGLSLRSSRNYVRNPWSESDELDEDYDVEETTIGPISRSNSSTITHLSTAKSYLSEIQAKGFEPPSSRRNQTQKSLRDRQKRTVAYQGLYDTQTFAHGTSREIEEDVEEHAFQRNAYVQSNIEETHTPTGTPIRRSITPSSRPSAESRGYDPFRNRNTIDSPEMSQSEDDEYDVGKTSSRTSFRPLPCNEKLNSKGEGSETYQRYHNHENEQTFSLRPCIWETSRDAENEWEEKEQISELKTFLTTLELCASTSARDTVEQDVEHNEKHSAEGDLYAEQDLRLKEVCSQSPVDRNFSPESNLPCSIALKQQSHLKLAQFPMSTQRADVELTSKLRPTELENAITSAEDSEEIERLFPSITAENYTEECSMETTVEELTPSTAMISANMFETEPRSIENAQPAIYNDQEEEAEDTFYPKHLSGGKPVSNMTMCSTIDHDTVEIVREITPGEQTSLSSHATVEAFREACLSNRYVLTSKISSNPYDTIEFEIISLVSKISETSDDSKSRRSEERDSRTESMRNFITSTIISRCLKHPMELPKIFQNSRDDYVFAIRPKVNQINIQYLLNQIFGTFPLKILSLQNQIKSLIKPLAGVAQQNYQNFTNPL